MIYSAFKKSIKIHPAKHLLSKAAFHFSTRHGRAVWLLKPQIEDEENVSI